MNGAMRLTRGSQGSSGPTGGSGRLIGWRAQRSSARPGSNAPSNPRRRHRHVRPGRRDEQRSRVEGIDDDVDPAREGIRGYRVAVAEELDRGDRRRRPVDVGADAAPAEGIQVLAAVALREMDVLAAPVFTADVADQLVDANDLVVLDGRHDVPVPERSCCAPDGDGHAAAAGTIRRLLQAEEKEKEWLWRIG